MKAAIMQPYFFPYIGYFQLMNAVDQWVIFDDTQFINKGWINRNRVLHPDGAKEWQYIVAPLEKKSRFDKIYDISRHEDGNWKAKIMGQLSCYKKEAPYYRETITFVEECLASEEKNLTRFLEANLRKTAEMLGLATEIKVQSQLGLGLATAGHPGQWALHIAEKIGASGYVNPHGGVAIFDEKEYEKVGRERQFLKPTLKSYDQRRADFVSGLSIIDVMMWNSPAEIADMLKTGFALYSRDDLLKLMS